MNEALHTHRAKVIRSFLQRIANLTKLERYSDAADTTLYLASILRLWGVQDKNLQEAAMKKSNPPISHYGTQALSR